MDIYWEIRDILSNEVVGWYYDANDEKEAIGKWKKLPYTNQYMNIDLKAIRRQKMQVNHEIKR